VNTGGDGEVAGDRWRLDDVELRLVKRKLIVFDSALLADPV
jgi:hypothetical protein